MKAVENSIHTKNFPNNHLNTLENSGSQALGTILGFAPYDLVFDSLYLIYLVICVWSCEYPEYRLVQLEKIQ